MKRVLAIILQLCLFAFCITACGQSENPKDASVPAQSEEQEQTEYLEAIPAAYFENSDRPGQVVQVTYESRDYTGDDVVITKPAFVYLPYGYDESDTDTRYDILYLMYGWTMTANDFLGEGRSHLVNILDNMIASGDVPPVIVVSATFDAENQPQSFSRSVEELSVFHNDLRENLMPYIEDRFHTYAEDVTEEGFEASREHRAFGGFSLGAVTTWYQFIYNLDSVKNFVPMSGDCWIMGTYGGRYYPMETVDYLEDMLSEGGYSVLNATEFSDHMAEQMGWESYGDRQYVPHVLRYYVFGRIQTGTGSQAMVQAALTQEGNSGNSVRRRNYFLGDSRIYGYGIFRGENS